MLEQPDQWVEPEAGFQYLADTISVAPTHQTEKLAACGIDAGIFGEQVDPAFFIGIAIHAGIRSGTSAEGNINMLQGLQMHRPPLLDEPLNVRGEILEVRAVPRGRRVHTDVWFEDGTRPSGDQCGAYLVEAGSKCGGQRWCWRAATASDRRAGRTAAIE